ncbi:MAG: AAA family ATPase [Labilithrix sp.]|nr:AAA family ATPase [Labilithrix sp.]
MSGTDGGALIGRDDELARARRLIGAEARLVTLVGPPGAGKTRVLRQLARGLVVAGSDVRVVFLRDLTPSGVLAGVLRALGGTARTAPRASAIARAAERMERRATVLVLDEAEHVREEVAELVTAWLDGTTHVRVLVSSRERLDVSFEHVVRIEPLAPEPAAALLRHALERAASRWEVTDADARRLVARVDGLPLGIELLASRVAALGPAGVLAGGARALALPPLDEVLDESYALLGADARRALEELSVFRDGFTLDAAALVLGSSDDGATKAIEELVDASLVRPIDGPGERPRFEMLGVVQAFAVRKLAATGRAAEVERRHLGAFVELGEREREDLAPERANLLAALDRAKAFGDGRAARALALALDPLLVRGGPPDLHRDVLLGAIETPDEPRADPARLAELHRAYGRFLALRGRFGEATAVARRAAALATESGDRRVAAWVASFECFALRPTGDLDGATRAGLVALAYAHEERDLGLEAMAEQALGLVEHARGDHAAALERYLRSLAAARRAGDERSAGIALGNRALTLLSMGDHAGASEAYEAARACFAAAGDRYHLARIAPVDVALARGSGDLDAAESRFASALDAVRDHDDLAGEAELLLEGARIAALRRARARAEARLAEATLVARGLEDVFLAAEIDDVTRAVRRAERGELTLELDAEARAVELTGGAAGRAKIDLSRRPALRRILLALAERRARGERGLSSAEALEAGWPGERMRAESGSARVYMAVRRLRALGLDEVIVTTDAGYALSSLVHVVRGRNC